MTASARVTSPKVIVPVELSPIVEVAVTLTPVSASPKVITAVPAALIVPAT